MRVASDNELIEIVFCIKFCAILWWLASYVARQITLDLIGGHKVQYLCFPFASHRWQSVMVVPTTNLIL